jgi:hypothetical protein
MRFLLALAALALVFPALANDSTAELGAGGINLVRNEAVDLLSEDLFVSMDQVKVTYHFRNHTDAPVTYLVAFPLPPLDAKTPEEMNIVLPDAANDDFVDFHVTVDGKDVAAKLDQRVSALGVDRTDELKQRRLPLNPIADGLYDRLQALSPEDRDALNRIGMILVDPDSVQAAWRLDQTYYWEQTFPPGTDIVVEHDYKPVVGFSFFGDYELKDASYRDKYCMDESFIRTAKAKLAVIANAENPYLDEKRISYILTTANNWASPIRSFHLVIDKGSPDAIVSFCGAGVKKIGPTAFEVNATDYVPEKELEILIATPHKGE